jgi:hypothetical protein
MIIITLQNYYKIKVSTEPEIHKSYPKIELKSDIDILQCKLNQRICYYENISNTLESAIDNCKELDYCDSLKTKP